MATFWEIVARSVSNLFLLYFVYLYYLFISRFGFKSGICLLIAPVPVHCFSITFNSMYHFSHMPPASGMRVSKINVMFCSVLICRWALTKNVLKDVIFLILYTNNKWKKKNNSGATEESFNPLHIFY